MGGFDSRPGGLLDRVWFVAVKLESLLCRNFSLRGCYRLPWSEPRGFGKWLFAISKDDCLVKGEGRASVRAWFGWNDIASMVPLFLDGTRRARKSALSIPTVGCLTNGGDWAVL